MLTLGPIEISLVPPGGRGLFPPAFHHAILRCWAMSLSGKASSKVLLLS